MLYKMRYMYIPADSVKPLEYYIQHAQVGEAKEFNAAKEVENFIRQKYDEGWQFVFKSETESSFLLYFKKVE